MDLRHLLAIRQLDMGVLKTAGSHRLEGTQLVSFFSFVSLLSFFSLRKKKKNPTPCWESLKILSGIPEPNGRVSIKNPEIAAL